ncbi:MAG: hypothetical protein DCC50_03315 [Acidobacteria bacterium]|nr:MAG: hypothetical protein DCC50_03315 [Acidobacteriota bacterium]
MLVVGGAVVATRGTFVDQGAHRFAGFGCPHRGRHIPGRTSASLGRVRDSRQITMTSASPTGVAPLASLPSRVTSGESMLSARTT